MRNKYRETAVMLDFFCANLIIIGVRSGVFADNGCVEVGAETFILLA